jgi:hypothetical protein
LNTPPIPQYNKTFPPRLVIPLSGGLGIRLFCQMWGGLPDGWFSLRGLKVRLFLFATMVASQKTQHMGSHVATIFCNHLAKLLQKIITSQPSATHPNFGPNLPFHEFPKHFNHNSWFQISMNS